MASSGICHRNEVSFNCMTLSGWPCHEIISVTLHHSTLHVLNKKDPVFQHMHIMAAKHPVGISLIHPGCVHESLGYAGLVATKRSYVILSSRTLTEIVARWKTPLRLSYILSHSRDTGPYNSVRTISYLRANADSSNLTKRADDALL